MYVFMYVCIHTHFFSDVGGLLYLLNQGPQNYCDDSTTARLSDPATCQQAAAALGWEYKGEESLDYCARGCFLYDGAETQYNGVYWNSHPTGGEMADHHLICQSTGGSRLSPSFSVYPFISFSLSPSARCSLTYILTGPVVIQKS